MLLADEGAGAIDGRDEEARGAAIGFVTVAWCETADALQTCFVALPAFEQS